MSAIATAVIGGAVLTSATQRSASNRATAAQTQASDASIAEQQRQFDKFQELISPYLEKETGALGGLLNLIGLKGPQPQQSAIQQIEAGPEFQSIIRQGEEAILQNASATGGLRGGNTQAALARFRQGTLSDLINQQFSRYANVAQLGQASAVGAGSAGLQTGANIGNILQNRGEAIAQGAIAQGNANAQLWGNIAGAIGYAGYYSQGGRGW